MDALVTMLENAMAACNLNQQELSKLSGVYQPRISELLNGHAHPSFEVLEQLAPHLQGKLNLVVAKKVLADRKIRARPRFREAMEPYGKNSDEPPFVPLAQLPLAPDLGINIFTTENPPSSPIIASRLIVEAREYICHGIQVLARIKKNPPTWHICNYCEGVMDDMDVYAIVGAEK